MPNGKFITSLHGQTLKRHLSGREVKASRIPADVLSTAWGDLLDHRRHLETWRG